MLHQFITRNPDIAVGDVFVLQAESGLLQFVQRNTVSKISRSGANKTHYEE